MIPRLALALVLWLLALLPATAAAPAPLPGDSVYQLQVRLHDQAGRPVDWQALRGRPRLVAMFYSRCPFMCPLIIEAGKGIEHALSPAQRARLGVAMVSIDPVRDTPATLAAMARARKVDPRWLLLQPRPGDVRALAGLLRIRYRALENGEFNHTSAWILLDAQGRELARSETMGTSPDPVFLAAVRKALAI